MAVTAARALVAVWTADCSATVQLSRCSGPRAGRVRPPACWAGGSRSGEQFDLSNLANKAALYECVVAGGTPFDIYRWINLSDLALLWPRLRVPSGVRAEWGAALAELGLLVGG
jgi:hypothetical protein